MVDDALNDLLRQVERRLRRLPTLAKNQYKRQCLKEAKDIVRRCMRDLEDLSKDRAPINADIMRAFILIGEGGLYGKKKKRRTSRPETGVRRARHQYPSGGKGTQYGGSGKKNWLGQEPPEPI